MNIVNGARGSSRIYISVADDHSYHVNRRVENGKLYLRCREKSCSATLIYCSMTNQILKQSYNHNHRPDEHLREKTLLKDFLKDEATTSNRTMEDIFLDGQQMYPAAALRTGGCSYFKSSMSRARNRSFGNIPTNLEQLAESLVYENNIR